MRQPSSDTTSSTLHSRGSDVQSESSCIRMAAIFPVRQKRKRGYLSTDRERRSNRRSRCGNKRPDIHELGKRIFLEPVAFRKTYFTKGDGRILSILYRCGRNEFIREPDYFGYIQKAQDLLRKTAYRHQSACNIQERGHKRREYKHYPPCYLGDRIHGRQTGIAKSEKKERRKCVMLVLLSRRNGSFHEQRSTWSSGYRPGTIRRLKN